MILIFTSSTEQHSSSDVGETPQKVCLGAVCVQRDLSVQVVKLCEIYDTLSTALQLLALWKPCSLLQVYVLKLLQCVHLCCVNLSTLF